MSPDKLSIETSTGSLENFDPEKFEIEYLEFFSRDRYNDIAHKLVDSGYGHVVMQNLDEFPELNLDKEMASKLIDSSQGLEVMRKFSRFHGLDKEIAFKIIDLNGGVLVVAENLDRFHGLDKEIVAKITITPLELMQYYTERRRFGGLLRVMQLFEQSFPFEESRAVDYLKDLLEEKNFFAARDLISCMDVGRRKIELVLREKIIAGATEEEQRRKKRPERALDTSEKTVVDEMAIFYINDMIKVELQTIKTKMKTSEFEISFRDKVHLMDIEHDIERNEAFLYKWLKEYLILPIFLELDYYQESQLKSSHTNVNLSMSLDNFLRIATDEEIRQYLFEARQRFKEKGWGKGYGGEKWARVAEVAEDLWKDNQVKSILIDRVFNIEHASNGLIFSHHQGMIYAERPPDRAKSSWLTERLILDLKRTVQSIDILLDGAKQHISPITYQKLINRMQTLRNIRYGYHHD